MKVLVAGATGALGVPLVRALVAGGHEVLGLTRSPGSRDLLTRLGARPVVADALDRDGLLTAVSGLEADAVIHELTALKKIPFRHRGMAVTNALREQGTANLLAAARAVGARRFVTQSMIFGYGYGDWGTKVLTEDDPFAPRGRGRFEEHLAAMRSNERQTLTADGIDGIALRYGALYGPDASTRAMVDLLRRRRLPVPRGGGVMSLIYLEDAVAATVAALERGRPGEAYNVVDDEPVAWRVYLGALADAVGAPPPRELPRWLFRFAGSFAAAVMTGTYRVSNAKAKRELGWRPAVPTCRQGIPLMVAALAEESSALGAAPPSDRRVGIHAAR